MMKILHPIVNANDDEKNGQVYSMQKAQPRLRMTEKTEHASHAYITGLSGLTPREPYNN